MSVNEETLEKALVSGNFLAVCEETLDDPEGRDVVRKKAEEQNLVEQFDEGCKLARVYKQTREAVDDAATRTGMFLWLAEDGSWMVTKARGKKETYDVQISSPLLIVGVGYSHEHRNPQLSLKVHTETGNWNDIIVPRADLTNSGTLQATLKKVGIRTADSGTLSSALSVVEPRNIFRTCEHAGWNGDDFALPNGEVITKSDGIETHCVFPLDARYGVAGSKEEADRVLKKVEDDPHIMTAIGVAMGAPLLKDIHVTEPGVYHFFGDSTIGKTTTLCIAASMFGWGEEAKKGGIVELWYTTAYAAEQNVSRLKDHAVFFDESALVDSAEDFQTLSYSLANGSSKAAGQGYNGLREVRHFRSPMLSTGEYSGEHIIKNGGLEHTGGSALRLLDVPFRGFQVEDPRTLANEVRECSKTNYGHHFRALVKILVKDRDGCVERIRELMKDALVSERQAQLARVHQRLSLVAAVLEFSIERGIFPTWTVGKGKAAVQAYFNAWKEERGSEESYEVNKALTTFSETMFSQKHRIHFMNASGEAPRERLAAFLKGEYWFTEKGLIEAVGSAKLVKTFLDYLASDKCEDWGLRRGSDKKRMKCETPKGYGLDRRMYCIVDKNWDASCATNFVDGEVSKVEPTPSARKLHLVSKN